MMLQLNPSIPVYIVNKDVTGECIGWIDYSKEDDLLWIVALDNTGERRKKTRERKKNKKIH